MNQPNKVGLDDSRPLTQEFDHQNKNKNMGNFKHHTWHMTYDMWHMTCDIWHVTHGVGETFSQISVP